MGLVWSIIFIANYLFIPLFLIYQELQSIHNLGTSQFILDVKATDQPSRRATFTQEYKSENHKIRREYTPSSA